MAAALPSLGHRASDKLKLALEHSFPRDDRIAFVEDTHTYYVDGVQVRLSVTGLVESVAGEHFDPDAALISMKRRWPNPKYADVLPDGTLAPWTDVRIKQSWADAGKLASELGTDLHSKIECFLNDVPVSFGPDPATNNRREFGYFLAWWEGQVTLGWRPFRTEAVIFEEVAGSVDFIAHNSTTGKYGLIDWKRCKTKEAGFAKSFGKRFQAPLQHLEYHKMNKWSLQINVYREILERNYGLEIESMAMVVFHEENEAAAVFSFPRTADARTLLNVYNANE